MRSGWCLDSVVLKYFKIPPQFLARNLLSLQLQERILVQYVVTCELLVLVITFISKIQLKWWTPRSNVDMRSHPIYDFCLQNTVKMVSPLVKCGYEVSSKMAQIFEQKVINLRLN